MKIDEILNITGALYAQVYIHAHLSDIRHQNMTEHCHVTTRPQFVSPCIEWRLQPRFRAVGLVSKRRRTRILRGHKLLELLPLSRDSRRVVLRVLTSLRPPRRHSQHHVSSWFSVTYDVIFAATMRPRQSRCTCASGRRLFIRLIDRLWFSPRPVVIIGYINTESRRQMALDDASRRQLVQFGRHTENV